MDKDVKVSIITVTRNAVSTIEQTISSVLNQTYQNVEYIIVDGMSTDGTWEKLCGYRNSIDTLVHEKDKGLYDAMNKGISLATGDIVGIINGDDWYEKDAVENVVREFTDNVDLIYGNLNIIDQMGNIDTVAEYHDIEEIWYRMPVSHPTVFVRKRVYNENGKFNLDYDIAADYELMLRFYTAGVKFKNVDKILANFRIGGLSTKKFIECANEVKKISMLYMNQCPDKNKLKYIDIEYNNAMCQAAYELDNKIFKENINKAFHAQIDNICIFGAGRLGRKFAKKLKECSIPCRYFIDNDPQKQGTTIAGIEVIPPGQLKCMECNIIIALADVYDEVQEELEQIDNPKLYWIQVFELVRSVIV